MPSRPRHLPHPQRARSRHLKVLARRPPVRDRAGTPAGVRALGGVPGPDFRKTLTDAHLDLLETIFVQLAGRGRLPVDWVADQVVLERVDGDIDALITRLAHIAPGRTSPTARTGSTTRSTGRGARARSRTR